MSKIVEDHALQDLPIIEEVPLIDHILDANDKAILFAKYKDGKSIIALQISSCLAGGHDFVGYKVLEPKTVLYVAGEGDLDELQARRREMGLVLPTLKNHLYFWPLPEYPLSSPHGYNEWVQEALPLKPALTVLDPAYSLMMGGMADDEAVGKFIRAVNNYQEKVGGAILIIHHTHRPKQDERGYTREEGDEAYFGSMLWKAWPRKAYLLRQERNHIRVLSCETHRGRTVLESPVRLTLVEPTPLIFLLEEEGWTGPMHQVMHGLVEGEGYSLRDVERMIGQPHSTTSDSLAKLVTLGKVDKSEGVYRRV